MKSIFSILLFLFIANVYAQDTIYLKGIDDTKPTSKEKAFYYKVYNHNVKPLEVITYDIKGIKIVKEHFSSIKPLIRDGEYETYFNNGSIDTKGIFKNGLMSGVWLIYNKELNYIEQKINFIANLREDSAFIFNQYGKILQANVYKHNEIVSTVFLPSTKKIIDTAGVLNSAEVMPEFPGGTQALMSFLQRNIKYPPEANEKGLEGKVIVRFIIDVNGEVANANIIKDGVGGGCGNEALRVINMLPKWIPGKQDGKPVKVYFFLPVTFNIGTSKLNKKK